MAQRRKSLKRTGRVGRMIRRKTYRQRKGRNPEANQPRNNLFDWSSIMPRASIKSKTRFNVKNDWGLRLKGVLKV